MPRRVGFEALNVYMNQVRLWQREKAKRESDSILETEGDYGEVGGHVMPKQQRVRMRQSRRAIHQTQGTTSQS